MDFETLYMQGAILLDNLAVVICHVGGLDRALWYSALIQRFERGPQDSNYPHTLADLWQKHRAELLRHYSSFRIFRDNFIVHREFPFQRGSSMDTLGGAFSLACIISPQWLSPEQQHETFAQLEEIMPNTGLTGRLLLDNCLANVDKLDPANRRALHKLAIRVGFVSPTYHEVGRNLLSLASDLLHSAIEAAEASPQIIKLNLLAR